MPYNAQKAKLGTEVSILSTALLGTYQALTALTDNCAILIIQNDTDTTVTLSDDGTTNGISFAPGVRLVLDLRTNRAEGDDFGFPATVTFYAKGTAGASGSFKIAPVYARF